MKGKSDMWYLWMWMVYLLLLFCDLSYCCGSAEYYITGECCPMCSPGEHVYKHCTEYTSTSCKPCTPKLFMAVPNGLLHCITCTVCDPGLGLKTERECSPTSDAVCGPLDQHYCTEADHKKGCRLAQRHTICRPGTFIRRNGTLLTNTECEECRDKTFSNKSSSPFCKPHTECNSEQKETTKGTKTEDTVCENMPVRSRFVLFGPFIFLALVFSGLSVKFCKERNNPCVPLHSTYRTPVQETQGTDNGP
ncbi:hypothetical protein COCON_G00140530 [Conger conger]|uniref:TNFR-Cys domain-containing protein n=1 Tax=Conger conger TaxID=82655 RepID=A0A9Q1DB65_CONCO|nr:hypothetical protein COCON_G00140530 [Conger conger]